MTLISRRGLLAGAAGLGARRKRRCVAMYPDNPGEVLALLVVVQGDNGGVFVYNASGQLVESMAALPNVDPNTSSNVAGVADYDPATGKIAQMHAAELFLTSVAAGTEITSGGAVRLADAFTPAGTPAMLLLSPQTAAGVISAIQLLGQSADNSKLPQIIMAASIAAAVTSAFLEVQGTLTATAQISTTSLANIVANGGLIAQLGDITAQAGDLIANTAGKGLRIKGGANARIGTALLAGGTVTVANTSVTANTLVFPTHHSVGPNAGHLGWSVNPGVSFTITSTNAADANNINWLLVEQL